MTVYRIPPPARAGPAAAGNLGVEKWLCGVAASPGYWPPAEYAFQIPPVGRPVLCEHREHMITSHGMAGGEVGVARRFAVDDDLGLLVLIEISADQAGILWDLSEQRRAGLSIKAHLDPPPNGGPAWAHVAEVSLTSRPRDPLARVVSSGQLGLDDWESLTGEVVTP